MKKYLLTVFIWLLCLPDITAKLVYENVEIDGFTYDLYEETRFYDGDSEHSIGYIRGLSDQRYAEFCESRHLCLPSTIKYDGEEYLVAFGWDFFERRDFQEMEIITFGGYTIEYLNDFPNLKHVIMEAECIYGFYSSMRNLPSLQELELSVRAGNWDEGTQKIVYAPIRLCFNNLGIESLRISEDFILENVWQSFCDLPNITELTFDYISNWSNCFLRLPRLQKLTLGYLESCSGCFCILPRLQELTFEIAPWWCWGSFSEVPVLRKLTLKKWNETAVVRFPRSFMKAPMLKDIYVEESVPCDAYFYSKHDYDDNEEGIFYPSNVTLHVPVGSRELYAAAEGWKDFGEIVEYDPAGVDSTEADMPGQAWSCAPTAGGLTVSANSDVTVEVQTLAGATVRRLAISAGEMSSVELPAGVYIVAANGQSEKVCVR